MFGEPDDNSITLLRYVRWLLIRLPLLILVVNGTDYLKEGRTTRGVVDLGIAMALIAVDLFVIGRAIRRTKRQIKDPEYMKKYRDMSPAEHAKMEGLIAIRWCILWLIAGTGLFIVMPIVIQVKDLAFCLILGAFLVLLGVVGLIWGIRTYKNPEILAKRRSQKRPITDSCETLYRDFELSFEAAQEQYCKQTGKSAEELTEADDEIIWDYAYAQITYLFAWIAEHDFYEAIEGDYPYLAEMVGKIRTREISPTAYIAENQGTIFEGNIKEQALGFVKGYMNGTYFAEVETFAKEHLNAEMFGFPFRWEEYDIFKSHIDEAYAEFTGRADR